MLKKISNIHLLIIFLVVSILLLFYVFMFTPAVFVGEQWEHVDLFGKFDLIKMFSPVNLHRVILPRLVLFSLANLTKYDQRAENIFSLFCFVLILFFIFKYFLSIFHDKNMILLFFLALLSQFSPVHHESLLWGGGAHLMSIFFVSVAIKNSLSAGDNFKSLIIVILSLFAASFSFLSGLLGWVICLFGFFLKNRPKTINLLIFSFFALLCFALYFWGVSFSVKPISLPEGVSNNLSAISSNMNNQGLLVSPLSKLIKIVFYFFIYMGANFIPTYKAGVFLNLLLFLTGLWGVFMTAFGAFLILKTFKLEREKIFFPYLLILFSLLNCAITSIGRTDFGFKFALLSRYHAFQMLYFIGVIWLLIIWMQVNGMLIKYLKWFATLFLALFIIGWIGGIGLGIKKIQKFRPIENEIRQKGEKTSIETLSVITSNPKMVIEKIKILKNKRYNIFKDL